VGLITSTWVVVGWCMMVVRVGRRVNERATANNRRQPTAYRLTTNDRQTNNYRQVASNYKKTVANVFVREVGRGYFFCCSAFITGLMQYSKPGLIQRLLNHRHRK
jgi:hypothetical protein